MESSGMCTELETLGWGRGVTFKPTPRTEALLRGVGAIRTANPVFCSVVQGHIRGLRATRGGWARGGGNLLCLLVRFSCQV